MSRAAYARQLLDDLQERASPKTDGQLRDGVHQALCHFTHEQLPTCQIDSITALIGSGIRIDWSAYDRLPCA
ncbi:hypothetical protein ABZ366_04120 [Streptomyces sp. NPDC005904]|uniref:hypothetical protein n=1 Tax=Streptomyces sp. NPDC005904 TaxID=3154570 RepID=UPI003408D7D4